MNDLLRVGQTAAFLCAYANFLGKNMLEPI